MRTKNGNNTPMRKADLNSPADRFSTRLLMHRANKMQEVLSNVKELFKFRSVKFAGNASMNQPVWIRDKNMRPSQIVSFAVHGGLALLLLIPFASHISQKPNPMRNSDSIFAPPPDFLKNLLFKPGPGTGGGGGGGGERNPVPASVGRRPDFSTLPQIVPPSVPRNENAALILKTTLEGKEDPNIPNIEMNRWGDPQANLLTNSNGPGKGNGIGTGDGNGVGEGKGPGFDIGEKGGYGGSRPSIPGNGVTFPSCQYCPRPDYSDEARKVKYSGSVVLNVVVLSNGKPGRIEVASSPGMGLDEKAVEAVRGWLFKPGVGPNGKPVPTIIAVEVIFQLY